VGKTYTFQIMAKQDSYNVSCPCDMIEDTLLIRRTSRECGTSADELHRRTIPLTLPT
jgi:hypothetical protein